MGRTPPRPTHRLEPIERWAFPAVAFFWAVWGLVAWWPAWWWFAMAGSLASVGVLLVTGVWRTRKVRMSEQVFARVREDQDK